MTNLSARSFIPCLLVGWLVAGIGAAGCETRTTPGQGMIINPGRKDAGRDAPAPGKPDADPVDGGLVCLPDGEPKKVPGEDCACDSDCTTNTCNQGVCCTGAACGAKRPPGGACTDPEQCESGFCADGVCCNVACTGACVSCNQAERMGECTPVPAGAEDPHDVCREDSQETCGQSGVCNGQGGCAKYPQGTICKLGACEGRERFIPPGVCDGEGICQLGKSLSCHPSTCEDGACITSCTSDSQCMSPGVCRESTCGKRGPGQDCNANDQCASNFCVEGVCCENGCNGGCYTCALPSARGICVPVPANTPDPKMICKDGGRAACGDDGRCDGKGACQKYKDGTICRDGRCDAAANAETPAGTCRAGRCDVPANRTCAPHRGCSGSRCLTSCGSDGQCTSGNFCIGGTCGKRPDGAICSGDSQCVSGTCAQGRCCATGCTGSCKSCAVPGREGTCSNVPAGGADPGGTCRDDACSNGCNGSGGCRREPPGTTCGTATCSGTTRNTRVCNAGGTCETRSEACSGATPECMGGSCVPPAKAPNGDPCLAGAECQSGQCVRNRCCATACSGDCRQCLGPSWTCSNRGGTCGEGGMCSAGVCCPGGQTACGGTCRNLQTDTNHCGACGMKCAAATPTCVAGVCRLVCQTGQTQCGTRCVDLTNDVNNCGMCGKRCGAGAWTCGGTPASCNCANTVCGTTCCAAGKVCGGAGNATCVDPPRCNPTSCAAMGPCRECKADGTCGFKAPATSCDDRNACTSGETCNATGACTGGTVKTCTSPGACEKTPGTCNPMTGACRYDPNTGAACDDGDMCTTGEKCNANKVCTGGTTKTCSSPGACEKMPGTCDRMTGACRYDPNTGAACDDGDMCTTGEKCNANKVCTGGTTKTCNSPGVCEKAPGSCNPTTGACGYAAADEGAQCSDGDMCTSGDQCDGDKHCKGTPKVCNSPASCEKGPGRCLAGTGACEYDANVGAGCNDGDACTDEDVCREDSTCKGKPVDDCPAPVDNSR